MTARILVAALLSASSLGLSAQTLRPAPPPTPEMRAAQCDQERRSFADAGWDLTGVSLPCDAGLIAPTRIRQPKPQYTPAAMQQKIQGSVLVAAIVEADGSIREARVQKSLDAQFGLDRNALEAAKASTFAPAKLNGAPVRTLVKIEMYFTLR